MNNVGYCKAVERMLGVEIPPKAQAMRVILCELSRIIDHIISVGTGALDLGALTTFFHLFTYREKVYTLFERLCGARLTVSMTRIGGMAQDAPDGWFDEVMAFCKEVRVGVDEISRLLLDNKIFVNRTQGVTPISASEAINWGYTGPMLRACGVNLDLRKAAPYYGYDGLNFDVPVGTNGDIFDRYQVRIEEMRQSNRIVRQCVEWLRNNPGPVIVDDHKVAPPSRLDMKSNMEELIHHFKLYTEGFHTPAGEVYAAVEAPKGEFGIYLVSDGTNKPYRVKISAPGFRHLQAMDWMNRGHMLADVSAILGSLDIVFGEVDR
jgi:NADH-quinone oxidoreductase subunit C/D